MEQKSNPAHLFSEKLYRTQEQETLTKHNTARPSPYDKALRLIKEKQSLLKALETVSFLKQMSLQRLR